MYTLLTLLTLYNAVFLSTVLFNSQAWSNLKKTELEQLSILQLKFLKRSVKAPSSSPSAATLLEFGALPIKCEIHIKQLNFLHHILLLDSDDPVSKMYANLKSFPFEKNWTNDVLELLKMYEFEESENEIRQLSKRRWKKRVKKRVVESAFETLSKEAAGMTKTSPLKYEKLHTQSYLKSLNPRDVYVIFRARLRSITCKGNMPSSFRKDMSCRLCGEADETQEHALNCVAVRGIDGAPIDGSVVYDLDSVDPTELRVVCERFRRFNECLIDKT